MSVRTHSRWVAKALVQHAVGALPGGHRVNGVLQRRVTHRLPRDREVFAAHAVQHTRHQQALAELRPGRRRGPLRAFEFGAGYDLLGPMVRWSAGVDEQVLVDLRPVLRLELVNDTLVKLHELGGRLAEESGIALRAPDPAPLRDLSELGARFGITYLAPHDARDTGLPAGSFDLVTSTWTLEHIPAPEIVRILREVKRLLAPDGLVSCLVDLKDHFSYFEPALSPYNFLRYSDRTFALVNPALQWQNRLRAPEYRPLAEAAGLAVVREDPEPGRAEDLPALRAMTVARRFERFSEEERAARTLHLVLERGA